MILEPFLATAVQLLMLDCFTTGALEQKLTMMTPFPLVQELLFKGPKFLEGLASFAAKPRSFHLKHVLKPLHSLSKWKPRGHIT